MNKVTQAYLRFPLARRIEHWIMMLSFTILGTTGLPQRFPDATLSRAILNGLGGIETLRAL
jgi:cytochrome b subunit of formate dehydrogenase